MASQEVTVAGAQDITPDQRQALAEQAYEINERIKGGMAAGRQALWVLASALYEFEEVSGWLALGYEKKSDWLADPDITMTRRTYNRLVHTWRVLVVQRELDPGELKSLDASKVDIVLPRVEKGDVSLASALEDVKTLGARDLRDAYMAPKTPKVVEAVGATVTDVPQEPADAEGNMPDPEPPADDSTPEEPAQEPTQDVGTVLTEEMQRIRKTAVEAMNAWSVSKTDKSGSAMFEALREFVRYIG